MQRVKFIQWSSVLIGGLVVALLIVLVGIGVLLVRRSPETVETTFDSSAPTVDHSLEYYAARQASALIDIQGKVSQLGTACTSGAQCSFIVDGKTILYGPPSGLATDVNPRIGQEVRVKARAYEGGTYSVVNCAECSITEITP